MRNYNPSCKIWPRPIEIPKECCRRMIIIDGNNVLKALRASTLSEGTSKNKKSHNAAGLLLVVYTFLKQGYEVLVVAKKHLFYDQHNQNSYIFEKLEEMQILQFIEEDKSNLSLDDQVILHWATFYGAAVVSNDKFRDHRERWSDAVARRIGFKFEPKNAPANKLHLEENHFDIDLSLKVVDTSTLKNTESDVKEFDFGSLNSNVALCSRADPEDFNNVFKTYRSIHPTYFEVRLRKCGFIADYIQLMRCVVFKNIKGQKLPAFEYMNKTRLALPSLTFERFYEEFSWYYKEGKLHEYAQ
ncbi:hypothetical protein M3Y97_00970800 [Aphelenchoides bicaudatus]|nr:hypothetical protein M3Y97_00970800 [Aphelenchoides bicaudatus]